VDVKVELNPAQSMADTVVTIRVVFGTAAVAFVWKRRISRSQRLQSMSLSRRLRRRFLHRTGTITRR